MFQGLIFWARLKWLQHNRQYWRKRYQKRLSAIRITESGPAKREEILLEREIDLGDCDGEIEELQTHYLIDRAERYSLPIPHKGSSWIESQGSIPHWHLKPEAMVKLRSDIRTELKERWSIRLLWLHLVTGLTGIFGSLIGLVTVIAKLFEGR